MTKANEVRMNRLHFKDIPVNLSEIPQNPAALRHERSINYVYAMLENTQPSTGGITYKDVFWRSDLRQTFKDTESKQPIPSGVTIDLDGPTYEKVKELLEATTWAKASPGVEACCRAIIEYEEVVYSPSDGDSDEDEENNDDGDDENIHAPSE